MKKKCFKIYKFFKKDIWLLETQKLCFFKRNIIKILKILIIALQNSKSNKITTKVTSLTFYSILSAVPVIALAFAITKSFGFENVLKNILKKNLSGQEQVINYILEFSNSLLQTTKGGLVALVSVFFLLFIIIRMIKKIDQTFNDIWNVKKTRNWKRRFADYFAILIVASIFLLLAISLTVFINAIVKSASKNYQFLDYLSPALLFLMKILPYILLWLVFILMFLLLPKAKVKFKSALIAGIIAGSLYQLTQWGYISFQIGVGRYNAIYGSFAALPLFIIWLQISWYIILFCAEIAYALQNFSSHYYKFHGKTISSNQKKWIALLILNKILISFKNNDKFISINKLSESLDFPVIIIKKILNELYKAELIVIAKKFEKDKINFIPAFDVNKYRVNMVFSRIDNLNYSPQIFSYNQKQKYNKFLDDIKKNNYHKTKVIDIKHS